MTEETKSNIRSLVSKRQEHNRRVNKETQPVGDRIRDLEQDMLRVVEMCMELDATVHHQAKMIRILSRLLRGVGEAVESINTK